MRRGVCRSALTKERAGSATVVKLILVRHPSPDIRPGICYGRLDMTLRADAGGAVCAIVSDLAGIGLARVWTSPAIRCRLVAETVATAAGAALQIDARLHELDFGAWEGRRWNELPRAALDLWADDPYGFAPPQGESGAALLARVRDVHKTIVAKGEDCAVVSHGGPLKLLAALIREEAPDLLAQAPALGSVQVLTA